MKNRFWIKISSSFLFLFGLFGFLLNSCDSGKKVDTQNQGNIHISVDNTIEPIIREEQEIFQYDFPDAQINTRFLPENQVFHELLKDSIHFAIVTRKLSPDERLHFANKKIEIYENRVAYDGIGLIIHRNNPDSTYLLSQIQDILNGKLSDWSQITDGKYKGKIRVILDHNGSSIERALLEKFGPKGLDSKNIYSLNGNQAVAEYVSKNPESLGFIGMNWLNNNDSASARLASNARVISLSDSADSGIKVHYYKPSPENIRLKKYPLYRSVYTLSVEGHAGLGTGFAVFLSSDKGQLIFSKSGLAPIREATREIHLN